MMRNSPIDPALGSPRRRVIDLAPPHEDFNRSVSPVFVKRQTAGDPELNHHLQENIIKNDFDALSSAVPEDQIRYSSIFTNNNNPTSALLANVQGSPVPRASSTPPTRMQYNNSINRGNTYDTLPSDLLYAMNNLDVEDNSGYDYGSPTMRGKYITLF